MKAERLENAAREILMIGKSAITPEDAQRAAVSILCDIVTEVTYETILHAEDELHLLLEQGDLGPATRAAYEGSFHIMMCEGYNIDVFSPKFDEIRKEQGYEG